MQDLIKDLVLPTVEVTLEKALEANKEVIKKFIDAKLVELKAAIKGDLDDALINKYQEDLENGVIALMAALIEKISDKV